MRTALLVEMTAKGASKILQHGPYTEVRDAFIKADDAGKSVAMFPDDTMKMSASYRNAVKAEGLKQEQSVLAKRVPDKATREVIAKELAAEGKPIPAEWADLGDAQPPIEKNTKAPTKKE